MLTAYIVVGVTTVVYFVNKDTVKTTTPVSSTTNDVTSSAQPPPSTYTPPAPTPLPTPAYTPLSSHTSYATDDDCDPNYAGGCVPNVSYDLDCPDIGFTVTVVGVDRHRFDRDKDGVGCE